jgi:hypothetical protein
MSSTHAHQETHYWSDDERKRSSTRRSRVSEEQQQTDAGFDLFKMLRELREEELERMCSRPKHWPKEKYINYTFEPMPQRPPRPPPPPSQHQQHQQHQPRSSRDGDRDREDGGVLSNKTSTLYGVAVSDKVMRHAYS